MTPLDRTDRQIAHALGVNGRITFRQLAGALDVSEYTVARRYRRLVDEKVVRVVATRTPQDEDQGEILRLQIVPGSASRLARALVLLDEVAWVRTAGSGAEIVCGVRSPSPHRRDQLILEQLPKTGQITRLNAHHVLHHFHTTGRADWEGFPDQLEAHQRDLIRPATEAAGDAVVMSEADATLLKALALDARRSATQLASATGQAESTVRRRVDQLFATGAITLDRDLDTTRLGFNVNANLYVAVDPRRLHAAGSVIAAHDPTMFVAAVTGPTNLLVTVTTRTISELYDYVSSTLARVRGVAGVDTSLTGPYLKHARMSWR